MNRLVVSILGLGLSGCGLTGPSTPELVELVAYGTIYYDREPAPQARVVLVYFGCRPRATTCEPNSAIQNLEVVSDHDDTYRLEAAVYEDKCHLAWIRVDVGMHAFGGDRLGCGVQEVDIHGSSDELPSSSS